MSAYGEDGVVGGLEASDEVCPEFAAARGAWEGGVAFALEVGPADGVGAIDGDVGVAVDDALLEGLDGKSSVVFGLQDDESVLFANRVASVRHVHESALCVREHNGTVLQLEALQYIGV